MKLDVYIPTYPPHFRYLNKVVDMYLKSTEKADNIVISVSGYKDKNKSFFDDLEKKESVKVIRNKEVKLTAENLLDSNKTDSDIILYHGSDDYPHHQRIEVVKYFFKNYDIKHLHHSYHKCNDNLSVGKYWDSINQKWGRTTGIGLEHPKFDINKTNIYTTNDIYQKYFPDGDINNGSKNQQRFGYSFDVFNYAMAMGACAIRKEVMDDIKWSSNNFLFARNNGAGRGQDYEYFMRMVHKYNKGLLISFPLYFYNTPSYK
jgi:hypothetical protein